jgi:O-antigen/teichoic acid export membrane protein
MSVRKSLGWSVSQQIWTYVLFLINMVVNARLLSPEEIGVFVLALSVHMILHATREMGVTHYLIREKDLPEQKIAATVLVSTVLAFTLGLIVFLIRGPMAAWFETPGLADVLVFVAITLWIFPFEHASAALVRRDMRFKATHHIAIFSKFVSVAVTLFLAWIGFSYMALAWGLLTEAILRAILFSYVEQRPWRIGPATAGVRKVIDFGGWTTSGSIIHVMALESEKFILGLTMGVGATGLYDRASRLPYMLRQALMISLGRVFLSAFARDIHAGVAIGPKTSALLGMTSGVLWPIFLILALIPDTFVLVVFGPQWTEVARLLPWLLLAQAIWCLLPQLEQILMPFGRVRLYFGARVVQAVVMIGCTVIAVPYGLLAFAQATAIAATIVMVFNWMVMKDMMDVPFAQLSGIHIRSAIASVIAAAPVALWVWADGSNYWVLIGALVLVPPLWALGLYLTRHLLATEVRRMLVTRRANRGEKPTSDQAL